MTDNAGYRPTDDSALRWEDDHCTKCGERDNVCKCARTSNLGSLREYAWQALSASNAEFYTSCADEIERLGASLKAVYKLAGGHANECQCRQCEIFEFLEPIVGNTSPRGALRRSQDHTAIQTKLNEATKLLRELKGVFAGDAAPHWVNQIETTMMRGQWLDQIDAVLGAVGKT
jgi:hypothetical protein